MSDNRTDLLLEDIQSKVQLLVEATSVLAQDMHAVKQSVARIPEMADDIKVLKAVQKEQGKELREHSRILNDHSRILNEHSHLLNDHSRNLEKLDHIEEYLIAQGMPQRA